MTLPAHVEQVRTTFARLANDKTWDGANLRSISGALIRDDPDLVKMWRALERLASKVDDLWVWAFLNACHRAINVPPYHNISGEDRRELSSQITKTAAHLKRLLTRNELDAHLIHINGALFQGFFLFEDFGENNRARIDAAGDDKLSVSLMVTRVAERAAKKITNEPVRGKKGKNQRAVRFVRLMADRNKDLYGKPLLAVLATACNALHNTAYEEADVSNLLTR